MKKSMPIQQTRQYSPKRAMVPALIAMAILFVSLSLADAYMSIRAIDVRITDFIQTLKSPVMTSVADFVSWFGMMPQGYLLIILAVAALFVFRRHREAIVLGVSTVVTIALNVLVKMMVRYPGPTAPQSPELWTAIDFTFPSGHVMFFMVFFGFIFYLIASQMARSWIKAALLLPFGFLLVFVGFFRVYLLAHWTSDVVGGYILGGMMLMVSILIYRHWTQRKG
jgi:undecaprenyl-diphosphatase